MGEQDQNAAFIEAYMIDFNGIKAAERIGMKEPLTGSWMMLQRRAVREEIDRRIAEQRAKNRITHAHIEGLLRDLAEVEPLDIWNENGELRPLQAMPPNARRAIKSIKRKVTEHYITGEEKVTLEIELWDKKGAIELLGKYKKMFTDKVEHSGSIDAKVSFSINGVIK